MNITESKWIRLCNFVGLRISRVYFHPNVVENSLQVIENLTQRQDTKKRNRYQFSLLRSEGRILFKFYPLDNYRISTQSFVLGELTQEQSEIAVKSSVYSNIYAWGTALILNLVTLWMIFQINIPAIFNALLLPPANHIFLLLLFLGNIVPWIDLYVSTKNVASEFDEIMKLNDFMKK